MDCAFLSLLGGASREEPGTPSCSLEQPLPSLAWALDGGGKRLAGRAGSWGPQSLSWLPLPYVHGAGLRAAPGKG